MGSMRGLHTRCCAAQPSLSRCQPPECKTQAWQGRSPPGEAVQVGNCSAMRDCLFLLESDQNDNLAFPTDYDESSDSQ